MHFMRICSIARDEPRLEGFKIVVSREAATRPSISQSKEVGWNFLLTNGTRCE